MFDSTLARPRHGEACQAPLLRMASHCMLKLQVQAGFEKPRGTQLGVQLQTRHLALAPGSLYVSGTRTGPDTAQPCTRAYPAMALHATA